MIGPMQIAYIVITVLGFLQVVAAKESATPIEIKRQETQGGTLFWIGLFLLILSVPIKIFG